MDMEKVVKGLNHCFHGQECCGDTECPYYIEHLSDSCCLEDCQENLKVDIIALLKEQEAEWVYGEDETGVDGWHCSYCGFFEPWFYEFTDDIDFIRFYGFCPSCGRRMISYTGKPTQEGR